MIMSQANARRHMLDSQLATNSVHSESVLAALDIVEREKFVPEGNKKTAYVDDDIIAEEGSLILSPIVFGRMLEVAKIKPKDVVLDIGCSTGYSSSVLSYLCKKVVAVESTTKLVAAARSNIEKQGIENVTVIRNDLAKGGSATAHYDKIFINGQVEFVPEVILDQLKPNGKLITVMRVNEEGATPFIVTLSLDKKHVLSLQTHFQANATILSDFVHKKSFKF